MATTIDLTVDDAPGASVSKQFATKEQLQRLRNEGILVIEDVFSAEECDKHCRNLILEMMRLSPDLKVNMETGVADTATWKACNLPPGPRSGLLQSVVSVFPTVMELRTDDRVRYIFKRAYDFLHASNYKLEEFFTSMDGINVRPHMKKYRTEKTKDWAHIDQVTRNCPELCIQGQVVLSDTTACFRASPKSHLVHDELLDEFGAPSGGKQWFKFTAEQCDIARKRVESIGGQWQVPIMARRGSVILWFSSVIHSAMVQTEEKLPGQDSIWRNWRMVVYVCHRPKKAIKSRKTHARRLKQCLDEGRVTNHWGSNMFPTTLMHDPVRPERLQSIVKDPKRARELFTSDVPDSVNKKMLLMTSE